MSYGQIGIILMYMNNIINFKHKNKMLRKTIKKRKSKIRNNTGRVR